MHIFGVGSQVAKLRKAVAMIMGGSYAMRGSNPGTDAFHLTGWIPETFPLKTRGRTWPQKSHEVAQNIGNTIKNNDVANKKRLTVRYQLGANNEW